MHDAYYYIDGRFSEGRNTHLAGRINPGICRDYFVTAPVLRNFMRFQIKIAELQPHVLPRNFLRHYVQFITFLTLMNQENVDEDSLRQCRNLLKSL